MATRLKTVEYCFPTLTWAENNVASYFRQITVYLPESSKVFRSVVLEIYADDVITATGGTFNKRNMGLSLGENAYYANTNTQATTSSAEDLTIFLTGDYTSYFNAMWSGSEMNCNAYVDLNQNAGTPVGMRDLSAKLIITYEYDDSSQIQVKTVYLPLNTTATHLDSSKPGSANASIPALDTWLPETGKDIIQMTVVIQGNDSAAAASNFTISMSIDSYGSMTTETRETALASCRWFRYFWFLTIRDNPSVMFDTSIAHDFYIWASIASRCGHLQAWMIITYEYDEYSSNSILNSLLLPMEIDSPSGGTSDSLAQSANKTLWIEEPGPITLKESALFFFYESTAAVTGLALKVGSAVSYTTYTDATSVIAGGLGLMYRCESYISLARGKNTLTMSVYKTTAVLGALNSCCMWMINYVSTKSLWGSGAHNHTVRKFLSTIATVAASVALEISDGFFNPPESSIFYNCIGFHYTYLSNSTSTASGVTIQAFRLGSEKGPLWEPIYTDISQSDPESGIRQCFATARDIFKRFTGDMSHGFSIGNEKLDISINRQYRIWMANACTAWHHLDYLITYHSIISIISGNITNYTGDGSGITVDIFKVENNEYILSTTTSVGGTYSVTWFDDTAALFAVTRQAGVYVGRSDNAYAVMSNIS